MKKIYGFALLGAVLAGCSSLPSKNSDDYLYEKVINGMQIVEVESAQFEGKFMKGCTDHSSWEFCREQLPRVDREKVMEIYVSHAKDIMDEEDIKPIASFFETENGRLFSEILYKQGTNDVNPGYPNPEVSQFQIEEIKNFWATPEWKNFEGKFLLLRQKTRNDLAKYIAALGHDSINKFEESVK